MITSKLAHYCIIILHIYFMRYNVYPSYGSIVKLYIDDG
uniref:Uncharacterized protein n=1 Tax=Nesodiprion zhejiangensis nucleopolyhedrovirus TaxID=3135970 RepID=A0AAN0N7E1_9BACU